MELYAMTKGQKPGRKKNTGIPYEIATQQIFQEILDREPGRTIKVQHDVQVQGQSTRHQIDVLWRFTIGEIEHLVIVQARDLNQKIKQDAILAFRAILDDIPGQPRGVMVTRTGFQPGARKVADAHGIKLFILREGSPRITITVGSCVKGEFKLYRAPDGRLLALLHLTVFRPDPQPNFELRINPSGPITRRRWTAPHIGRFQLFNAEKRAISGIGGVLDAFVTTMANNNEFDGTLIKEFPEPTFVRQPGTKHFFRLQSIRAAVHIVKEELPPIPLKPPGFVDFVLENLKTGEQQSFLRAEMRNGAVNDKTASPPHSRVSRRD
jgi:hypothetical protein